MILFKSVLKDELTDFLELREASKSKCTHDHDRHTLQRFDEYLYTIDCKDKNLLEEQMTGWIRTLTGKSGTIANVVVVIRIFLQHLKSYGVNAYLPPIPKISDDYLPYIFSNDEMNHIFAIADMLQMGQPRKNTLIHIEYPMILRLIYGCGLRIGETLLLKMKDIDLDTGVLKLKYTKGGKQRFVPMDLSLTEILKQYCMALGIIGYPDAYLFPTVDPIEAVTTQSAQHKFNDILELGGISLLGRKKNQRGPCMHCIRHVFVFNSFAKAEKDGRRIDDSVPYLSIYLGHDSLNETEKYLKFSSEMFPEAMDLFDGYTALIFPEVNFHE
ncbi:tyrosine-type recombinase/integrase [Clostridium lacusfryxellense]|uniref:tyrosine-type recombinase/integrase n=1 Tax=Clostridium lacusfryxellense TaxID=205328 RepID=UPI001C0B2CA2|nr:tyrosine-type recombinase/integrase [Clostridium lacusfryxellense]MBU3114602.1 tyrosine-type recombinase/integrase [Clostridium lacusfryxellense]